MSCSLLKAGICSSPAFLRKGRRYIKSMYLVGGKEHRSSLLFKEVHMPVSIIREHCNHIYLICQ